MSTTQKPTPFYFQMALDVRALKAAALGCIQKDSDQPYRHALHCVALDIGPDNVVAVGLDGHKMIAARVGVGVPELKPQSLLIPRKTIDKLKESATVTGLTITGERNAWGEVNPQAKGVFEWEETSISFTFQDEVYPDWRRLCPATATGEAADYDTAILDSVQKAYSFFFTKKKGHYVKILHNGIEPARVVFENVDAFAVIMPLRLDIPLNTPLPAWAVK